MATIRAVSFDAAGTLLFVRRSVGARYAEALARRGLPADAAALDRAFPRAFKAARKAGPYPDSGGEARIFWREVVRGTLGEACPQGIFEEVFSELFELFGRGEAWRVAPDAFAALGALRFLGLRLVVLSNADPRMRRVLEETGLAAFFDKIILSSDIGYEKPDRRAFAAATRALGLDPAEVLHVGDSVEEDALGAAAAGLRACRVSDDTATPVPGAHRVRTLAEVVDLVRAEAVASHERRDFARPTRNLVAELRGLPVELSRSQERSFANTNGIADLLRRARDGEPGALKGVSDLARGVIGAEEKDMDARGMLLDSWATLISPRLRDKCFPVDLDRDALVVFCVSPVARNELKFVERALIAAVRRLPGCSGVSRVVCRL